MKLPIEFENRLRSLLGDEEYADFTKALSGARTWGLRVNTLRISTSEYLVRTGFRLTPVEWTRDGFRHEGDIAPGRHPDYHAGLYYLQDPSAMLPAELLDPKPGDRVLDLCAAPGGKSVQLAAMMRNTGFLLTNDISPKRVKPLRRNLEGLGVACAAVANEEPEKLAKAFPAYFDAILLDVPCSGEGMFRKDETAVRSWKRHDAAALGEVQRSIVDAAWRMLRPGGRLVYSTCTFNPDENERIISWALDRFSDMRVDPVTHRPGGLMPGRADWAENRMELEGAVRIWPHHAVGEGHFAMRLRKTGGESASSDRHACSLPSTPDAFVLSDRKVDTLGAAEGLSRKEAKGRKSAPRHGGTSAGSTGFAGRTAFQPAPEPAREAFTVFITQELSSHVCVIGSGLPLLTTGSLLLVGSSLFLAGLGGVDPTTGLTGLQLEMPGLYVGDWENGRFEPSSALLHALPSDAAKRHLDLSTGSDAVNRYLHGETLMVEVERGWTAVCVDGMPLGWGKGEDGTLKNRYPKGWRML